MSFSPHPRSRVAWPADVPAPVPPPVDEPLVLPSPPPPARRTPLPLLASVVPVLGAVGLWLITGSPFALWFALLGPLIAVATLADGRRHARRDAKRAAADAASARVRVGDEIERRHASERAALRARHRNVVGMLEGDVAWRPGRPEELVVGSGRVPSSVRVVGDADDPDAARLRARARTLEDAPVRVPLDAGIAVAGPAALADAVIRGLVVQACLLLAPGELEVVGRADGAMAWTAALPHRGMRALRSLAVAAPGEPIPAADVVIARVAPGARQPPRCAAVLTLSGIGRATLSTPDGESAVEVEALGAAQAAALAAELADRAAAAYPPTPPADPVALGDLLARAPEPRPGGLPAVVAVRGSEAVVLDLVGDGPHAVVAGVTGAGKSELLITWVVALCARHSTAEVTFLLADFKGGTAFDSLRGLPHVTGVLTDLDGSGARRALESLRAEIRVREAELAGVGARDILDPRVRMPRLVIVVDEFAALLIEHPELQPVFTDVAARGRALGMHLVLGTQRVTGVVRESLLANCPLRISLRVTDPADSRAVLGVDDAARLPGDATARGTALVRRAADGEPHTVRVALAAPADIAAIAVRAEVEPRRPWLPALPARVSLAEITGPAEYGTIVLGLADEPEQQRRSPVLLRPADRGLVVVGTAGSGRTTALATVAVQVPRRRLLWVPADPERAWDAVARLAGAPPGTVAVIDDLDALLARFPLDHAHAVAERVERFAREGGDAGTRLVLSAQRLTGPTARIADLLPRRAILAQPSRADHIAVGGDGGRYEPAAPPGRALLDGRTVQFASGAPAPVPPTADPAPLWAPADGVTGVIVRRGTAAATSATLRAAGATLLALDDALGAVEQARGFDGRVVVVGDPDDWQRAWRVLGAVRTAHDLVIDGGCAAEYRSLTSDREPPPYCAPIPSRAWLLRPGEAVRRIRLPDPPR